MNITDEYVSLFGCRGSAEGHDSSLIAAGDQARRSARGDNPMIHKRAGSVLVMGAALAGVLGLGAGSAIAGTNAKAATTWTVKPGGAITAKAGKTTLTDKKTGSKLTCTSSSG